MRALFSRPLPRLVAVVAVQVLILLSVIAFKQYTVWTSETILLRVDTTTPRTVVGQGSMPMALDISRVEASELPGDNEFNMNAYVELQEGADGIWEPVAVHDGPTYSFEGTVLIRCDIWSTYDSFKTSTFELHCGLEDVYIDDAVPGVPSGTGHVVAVEVRVDRFGQSTANRFIIDGQPFDLESP